MENYHQTAVLFNFDNSYSRLPKQFYKKVSPSKVPEPKLIKLNEELVEELGLDKNNLSSQNGVDALSGNRIPYGADPLAMAYAGHQFGSWVPELGDGRALLLGEIISPGGIRHDIQLKGSGPTPFSRMGDGKAPLGPILREYIISESMHSLGIPTTRALSAIITGETINRELPMPGAILTRVSKSHVRIGTFEYFFARNETDNLRSLADYIINRHYPKALESSNPYKQLLFLVTMKQAELVAKWMLYGFIHGVMNTDNMQIAGETIDYGPCAFLDTYDPKKVFSSIDHGGRYSFENQPIIAHWNLACFAQSIFSLLDPSKDSAHKQAKEIIDMFPTIYQEKLNSGILKKLGLSIEIHDDIKLAKDLLHIMAEGKADFTLTFRRLCEVSSTSSELDGPVRILFEIPKLFDKWAKGWRKRLLLENISEQERKRKMEAINPEFIPRNHIVNEAIQNALDQDFNLFELILRICKQPFKSQPEYRKFMDPPLTHQEIHQTFCGT